MPACIDLNWEAEGFVRYGEGEYGNHHRISCHPPKPKSSQEVITLENPRIVKTKTLFPRTQELNSIEMALLFQACVTGMLI